MSLDHLNHYVFYPLCVFADRNILNITDGMPFITPDMISLAHVGVAALAYKLLIFESLTVRRIGVLIFDLRSWLDSYDGYVARSRANQVGMAQVSGSWGYFMDGICDGLAVIIAIVAIMKIVGKSKANRKVTFKEPRIIYYLRSKVIYGLAALLRRGWNSSSSSKAKASSSTAKCSASGAESDAEKCLMDEDQDKAGPGPGWTMVTSRNWVIGWALAFQQIFGSLFWNRFMQTGHKLLEIPVRKGNFSLLDFQTKETQSATFWIVSWSWKILNPHALMNFYLYSIFLDFGIPVLIHLHLIGFIPLLILAFTSEIHLQTIMWNMWNQIQQ